MFKHQPHKLSLLHRKRIIWRYQHSIRYIHPFLFIACATHHKIYILESGLAIIHEKVLFYLIEGCLCAEGGCSKNPKHSGNLPTVEKSSEVRYSESVRSPDHPPPMISLIAMLTISQLGSYPESASLCSRSDLQQAKYPRARTTMEEVSQVRRRAEDVCPFC